VEEQERADASGMWAVIRRHPVITATLVLCIAVGAIGAIFVPFEDWSVGRKIAAGALSGAWVGLLVTGTRMLGAWR
jgi:hypothetical protein